MEKLRKGTPILLLRGTADWWAESIQTFRMASALYEVKHPFRLVLLEGGDHAMTEHREEVDRWSESGSTVTCGTASGSPVLRRMDDDRR